MPAILLLAFALAADDPLAGRTATILKKRIDLDRPLGPTLVLLSDLGAAHKLPLVLDERAELKAPVRVLYKQTRLGDILAAGARHAKGRFALVGEVGYFGVAASADGAAAGYAAAKTALAKFPKEPRAALLARRRWEWDDQKTIAALAGEALAAAGVKFAGDRNALDLVPLAGTLADAPTLDVLLTWCALCDRTLAFDPAQGTATVAEFPDAILERVLRCRSVAEAARRAADANALPPPSPDEPAALAEPKGAVVKYRGGWSALWAASAAEEPIKPARGPAGKAVAAKAPTYRLDFKDGALEKFAKLLEQATGKAVAFDEPSLKAAGRSVQDRVNCTANNLTLPEVLDLALGPLGLEGKVGAETIVIRAKP